MNGKFIQQRGCELAAEHYHELDLKFLQYDIHRYWPYNIREPISDPAVSIAGREPTRGPMYITAILLPYKMVVHEYAENCILFEYNIQTTPTQAHGL